MPDLNIKGSLKFVGYTQNTITPGEDGGILVYEDGLLALGNVLGTVPQTEDLLEVVNSQDEQLLRTGRISVPVLGSVNGDSDYLVRGGQYGFFTEEEGDSSVAYFNLANVTLGGNFGPGLYKVDYTGSLNNPANTTSPTRLDLPQIDEATLEPEGIDGIFSGPLFIYTGDDNLLHVYDVSSSTDSPIQQSNLANITFLAEDDTSVFIAAERTTNANGFYVIMRINRADPTNDSAIIVNGIKVGDPGVAPVAAVNRSINLNAQVAQDTDNLYYRTFPVQASGGTDKMEISIIRLSKNALDPTAVPVVFINANDADFPSGRDRSMSAPHIASDGYLYVVLYSSDDDFEQEGRSGLYRKPLDSSEDLSAQTLSGLTGGLSYDPSLSISAGDALAVNNFALTTTVLINLSHSTYLDRPYIDTVLRRQGGNNFYVDNERLFINDLGIIRAESGGDLNILVSSPLSFLTNVITLLVDVNGTVFFFHDDGGDIVEAITLVQGTTASGGQAVWDTILTNNLAAADNSIGVDIGTYSTGMGEITIERAGRYLLTADLDVAFTGTYTGNSEFLGVKLTRGTTLMYLRPLARIAHLNPQGTLSVSAGVHQIQIQLYPYLEVNDVISINSVINIEENQINEFRIDLLSHSNFKFQRLGDD